MQDVVRQVMPNRIQVPQRDVDSVRYPGQGMPVSSIKLCERPENSNGAERPDVIILGNVSVVVKVGEAVLERREVNAKDAHRYNDGNNDISLYDLFHSV